MCFVAELKQRLLTKTSIYDLSRNQEFSSFYFIGCKETPVSIDFVTFVEADELTERQLVDLRDRFFAAMQAVSYDFGLRPLARNPNGLLAFVFQSGCSDAIASFIQKQAKASSFQKSAVMVSWAIDVPAQKIHTHRNPVSVFPPIYIVAQTVFPGLRFLTDALAEYPQRDLPTSSAALGKIALSRSKPVSSAKASSENADKLGPDFTVQLSEMRARIEAIFRLLSTMPDSKYSFPNAQKVHIFEKVDTYIETQTNFDQSQLQQAVADLTQEIVELQQRYPQVTAESEALTIVEVEFTEMAQAQPQRWRKLLELRRWLKGAKSGGLKLGEHFAEESMWGKTILGFLDGFTDED